MVNQKIFIAHSHDDDVLAAMLVEVLNSALSSDDIELFCTSVPDFGLRFCNSSHSRANSGRIEKRRCFNRTDNTKFYWALLGDLFELGGAVCNETKEYRSFITCYRSLA